MARGGGGSGCWRFRAWCRRCGSRLLAALLRHAACWRSMCAGGRRRRSVPSHRGITLRVFVRKRWWCDGALEGHSPSPLEGEGWGEGFVPVPHRNLVLGDPSPQPPPTRGGGEYYRPAPNMIPAPVL